LHLNGFGLNDSHCHAIAEELRTSDTRYYILNQCLNPAISAQGYGALLGLMNRVNAIRELRVDGKTWEAKLNFVSEMNRDHGRLEYMMNGTFSSKRRRWQWPVKLARLPNRYGRDEVKQVNYLLYELLEHPEFTQT
jgi:hypothetical protein